MATTTIKKTEQTGQTKSTSDSSVAENKQKQQGNDLLDKMFLNMLKDIYWAEQHLVPHLEEMQGHATTDELQEAIEDHILQTKKHVSRLEKVFKLMGEEAKAKKCDAMEGLTKEAKSMVEETKANTMTRDAAIIIAAQKVEHYEIASYGSMVQIARTLGKDRVAEILEQTLWEEEDTDQLLTKIAESYVNPMADEE